MGKGQVWIISQRVRRYLNIYILLDLISKNAVGQQNSLVTYQTITLVHILKKNNISAKCKPMSKHIKTNYWQNLYMPRIHTTTAITNI